VVLIEELSILESCYLRLIVRNSVLEKLRRYVSEQSGGGRYLSHKVARMEREKSWVSSA